MLTKTSNVSSDTIDGSYRALSGAGTTSQRLVLGSVNLQVASLDIDSKTGYLKKNTRGA